MEQDMKEVFFNQYCDSCVNKDTAESEEPCDECLETPARPYSHKPINFEEGEES